MSALLVWSALAGAAVVVEILTGTLYLLVIGIAAGITAFAAFLGLESSALQVALFSVAAIGGCLYLHSRPKKAPVVVADDVGASVPVLAINQDGTYRVRHRGTEWDAELPDSLPVQEGAQLLVVGVRGNRLICKLK